MIKWLQTYLIYILIGLIVAASTAFGVQSWRLRGAFADLRVANADLVAFKEANAAFVLQVDALKAASALEATAREELQDRLTVEVGQRQAVEKINARAVADLQSARAAAAASAAKLKRTLEAQYANDPEALVWSRGPVPRVVSDGLRSGWEKAQQAGFHRREAGAGGGSGDEAGGAARRADLEAAAEGRADAGDGVGLVPRWLLLARADDRHAALGAERAGAVLRRH